MTRRVINRSYAQYTVLGFLKRLAGVARHAAADTAE